MVLWAWNSQRAFATFGTVLPTTSKDHLNQRCNSLASDLIFLIFKPNQTWWRRLCLVPFSVTISGDLSPFGQLFEVHGDNFWLKSPQNHFNSYHFSNEIWLCNFRWKYMRLLWTQTNVRTDTFFTWIFTSRWMQLCEVFLLQRLRNLFHISLYCFQLGNEYCSWCYKTFFGGNLDFPKIKKWNKVCSDVWTWSKMWIQC